MFGTGALLRLTRGGVVGPSLAGGVVALSVLSEAATAAAAALTTVSFSEPHRRVNRDRACDWTPDGAIVVPHLPVLFAMVTLAPFLSPLLVLYFGPRPGLDSYLGWHPFFGGPAGAAVKHPPPRTPPLGSPNLPSPESEEGGMVTVCLVLVAEASLEFSALIIFHLD